MYVLTRIVRVAGLIGGYQIGCVRKVRVSILTYAFVSDLSASFGPVYLYLIVFASLINLIHHHLSSHLHKSCARLSGRWPLERMLRMVLL